MFVGGVPLGALASCRIVPALLDIDLTSTSGGLTCARNSAGTAIDASGVLQTFAANALRRTSAGLIVEAARQNQALQSGFASGWAVTICAITTGSGNGPDNVVNSAASITSAGVFPYIRQGFTFVSGTTYTLSCFWRSGTVPYIGIVGYDSSKNYNRLFNTTTGAQGQQGTDSGSNVSNPGTLIGSGSKALGNGWYRSWITFMAAGGANTQYGMQVALRQTNNWGDGTTLNNASQLIFGYQLEAGGTLSSFIPTTTAVASRAADAVTLPQSNIGRLLLTFDDGSQQTITGIDTTQPYTLVPANLNRPLITRLQGFAA